MCFDDLGNICNYKVRLQLFTLASPDVGEFAALENAQRVYGQYGICIEFANGQSLALSPLQRTTLEVVDGQCEWNTLSPEQSMVHSFGGS